LWVLPSSTVDGASLAANLRPRTLYPSRTCTSTAVNEGRSRCWSITARQRHDEVDRMRGLGRRTGWLGWAVAGVLLVSVGGVALAAQGATTTTQAPGASADKAKARAGVLGRGGWRHALGRRVLHGEVTVQTKDGVKTLVMAYGQVTVLSKEAITVKSSDGVETSFKLAGDTRFGFRNEPAPSAELKVGEDAFVAGEKSGASTTARRVVSGDLARRGAAGAGKVTP
jgi:hypothetical protein